MTAVLIDKYVDAVNVNFPLSFYDPKVGQSFLGTGLLLRQAIFHMTLSNPGAGTLSSKLYAHTGIYGSTGLPTGPALAASVPRDASEVFGAPALYTFNFTNSFVPSVGIPYFITIEVDTLDEDIDIAIGTNFPNTHSGNGAYFTAGSSWFTDTSDRIFYAYHVEPLAFSLTTGLVVGKTLSARQKANLQLTSTKKVSSQLAITEKAKITLELE